MADTWILSAQPGQRIELIVRDYTSRGVATSHDGVDSQSATNEAAADASDPGDDEEDIDNDGKSRYHIFAGPVN